MHPNPDAPGDVWAKFVSLPSQSTPKKHSRPVKRLTWLAHELAADGLLADAGKKAHAELHSVLDGAAAQYSAAIEIARKNVLTVEGKSLRADVHSGTKSFNDFLEDADFAVIEDAYRTYETKKKYALAKSYSEYLADQMEDVEDEEETLIDAHTSIAAMGLVPDIAIRLEEEAEKLAKKWLNDYRVPIKDLTDERRDVYRDIREASKDPIDGYLSRPSVWLQPTKVRNEDGSISGLPTFTKHLMCDHDGRFPEQFTSEWETVVLASVMKREGTEFWYRNPSSAKQESLGVTYDAGTETKIVRPDFVFFGRKPDGTIVADIVVPHGDHFADSMPKLRGLAAFAAKHSAHFRRIEAVAKSGGKLRVLDLTDAKVRDAIANSEAAQALYGSQVASDYAV